MITKQIEVCNAIIYSVSCEENDPVDIHCGGPCTLGYDFGVSPDEDMKDIKIFLEQTIKKYEQPLMSISTYTQKDFPVKYLCTKDKMESCIKKGY